MSELGWFFEVPCSRQWRKVHLGIDSVTLGIRAIEVTDNATGDAPMLPCLLDQIGAYDTKACYDAIAQRGEQAVIPTRKNGKSWKDLRPRTEARNAILHPVRRLGRRIWKRWTDYQRRSLVKTKMRYFKLLGKRVMGRDFDRQIAEL